jgi:protein involved in polysaccharide export with SLBB domain
MARFRFLFAALLMGWAALSHAAADGYRLGTGDKLRIKVLEWPDLSGEYTVSPAATVSMPIVGELRAEGTMPSELASAISDRLREAVKLTSAPSTTVEIIAFRPFFVLGDVQRPGEYAYRPGLTVLQAISIAGGYYRPAEAVFRLERDAISARGDIIVHIRQAKQLAARIARLEAEQKNSASVTFPRDLDAAAGSPDFVVMEEERAIFAANNDALAKTLESLDRYRELYEQEIATVKEQIATEKRQYAAVQKEFENIKSLADRGLSSLSRQLASERTLAQIAGTIQGLEATILRARQNISQTEQRRLDTLNERTGRINGDLQKTRAEAKESAERLQTARDLLVEAEVTGPALYDTTRLEGAAPMFSIARAVDGEVREIAVASNAAVQPGDVLNVERKRPSPRQQSGLRRDLAEAADGRRGVGADRLGGPR